MLTSCGPPTWPGSVSGHPSSHWAIGDGLGVGARSGRVGAVQHDDAAHGQAGHSPSAPTPAGNRRGPPGSDAAASSMMAAIRRAQAPVHRHVDGTEQRPAEEHVEIGQAVPVEQGPRSPATSLRRLHAWATRTGPPVLLRPRAPDRARHQQIPVVRPGPGQPPHQAGDRESVRWNHVSWGSRLVSRLSTVGEAGAAPFSDLDPTGGGVPGASTARPSGLTPSKEAK